MTLLEKINDRMDKRHKETLPGETNISNPPLGTDQEARGQFQYLTDVNLEYEITGEEIQNTLGTVHVSRPSIKHVFFLLRPFLKPLLEQFNKQEQQLSDLVKLITMEHVFIDKPFAISQNVAYNVDYLGHKFLYLMTYQPGLVAIIVNGTQLPGLESGKWYPLNFPRGTQITANVADATPLPVVVRACDLPMALYASLLGSESVTIGNVNLNAGSNIVGAVASKIEQLIEQGQGFTATTGVLSTVTTANAYIAMGLLASAISKNIYIYRIEAGAQNTTGDIHVSQSTSLDAAITTAITPLNNNLGSLTTSLATVKSTPNNNTTPTTASGTTRDQQGSAANLGFNVEFIQQATEGIFIPAGSTQAITIWIKIPVAGNSAQANIKWVEF